MTHIVDNDPLDNSENDDDAASINAASKGKPYFSKYAYRMQGKVRTYLSNFENCIIAIQNDDKLKDRLGFDETLQDHVVTTPKPLKPLKDAYIREVWEYISKECMLKNVSMENVHQAMMRVGEQNSFNPIKDWLDTLKWDGHPRVNTWLIDYLGCDKTDYNREIGRMAMIAIAARGLSPGCKADHMMILEGPQGIGKSTVCRILFSPWFSDTMPDISHKDASLNLMGMFGVEIAEMHAFLSTRVDAAFLKSFVSRQTEHFRPPYAKRPIDFPRCCSFIGTTNEDTYLRDATGGRRFWPVKCGVIDLSKLKEDRNKLLAEAVQRKRDGERWHPSEGFQRQYIDKEQEARREYDGLQDQIELNLTGAGTKPYPNQVTVGEVWRDYLGQGTKIASRPELTRIGMILPLLGYRRVRAHKGVVYVR
jgi:predicted P-loop ATPase